MTNKEALEILKTEWDINAEIFDTNFHTALNLAIKALAERPIGKWIMITEPDGFMHSKCSNCNQFSAWGGVPFCPNCGADMRKE